MGRASLGSRLRHRGAWVVAVVVLLSLPVAWLMTRPGPVADPPSPPAPPPAPVVAKTDFDHPTAGFLGSDRCSECHQEQADAYFDSSHARALATIDLDREPPDSDFLHEASGLLYRVYRQAGRLRHRESVLDEDGEELVLSDHPLTSVVGTGHQGRTYLVEIDGFLVQSPITWYTSRQRWHLAPGYDQATHSSFERPIPVDCLICHAGRSESLGGAYHKVAVLEQRIGCERCHGPGSVHVAHQESAEAGFGGPDHTIVHPGRLPREKLESVCAQCHIQNNAAANVRGHRLADFRPSHRLAEYRAYFVLEDAARSMTVVGHVEQLHQSACYTQTKSLTCTTCHDPHRHLPESQADAWYRQKCLNCHAVAGCKLPADGPRRQERQDHCAACHMPTTTTEIPHVASTHHRIGVHAASPPDPAHSPGPAPTDAPLVPLYDLSHLSQLDQDRCRGLAYRQLSSKQRDPRSREAYRVLARETLEQVYDAGLRDSELLSALADLLQYTDAKRAGRLAALALQKDDGDDPLTPQDRLNALVVRINAMNSTKASSDPYEKQLPLMERYVSLNRSAGAWIQLIRMRTDTGDDAGGLVAAETTVSISPQIPEVREMLANLYDERGRPKQAAHQRRVARALRRIRERQK